MERRACRFVLVLAVVLAAGCSVLFGDDQYRNDGGADVRDAGPGADAGPPSDGGDDDPDAGPTGCTPGECDGGEYCRASDDTCVPCDADGDGFVSENAACDDLAGSDPRDCDDDEATVYPEAPAVCGDGFFNACPGTGLEVPETIATALSAAEVGRLEPRQLAETTTGYFDSGHLAVLEGSDGSRRLVATWARSDDDLNNVQIALLDGATFETLEEMDLSPFADGFSLAAVRTLDDGTVGGWAFRYGDTTGEFHYFDIEPDAATLSAAVVTRVDVSGSCLFSGVGLALLNYPDHYLVMNGEGAVGSYNRWNEDEPHFFVTPEGTVGCSGNGFRTNTYLSEGGGRFFAERDDIESNPTFTMWSSSDDSADSFSASVPLSFDGPSSLDYLGADPGTSLERLVFLGPSFPEPLVALPIDCVSESLGGNCMRGGSGTAYEPSRADEVRSPMVRRLTARTAGLLWVEDRSTGATPPNTLVQELVMHVADRDGVIDYATSGDPGPGLPVLRYELDESASDYRIVKTMDSAIVRDAATGDLTVYGLGVYSQITVDSFTYPEASEVRVGGVRVCVSE